MFHARKLRKEPFIFQKQKNPAARTGDFLHERRNVCPTITRLCKLLCQFVGKAGEFFQREGLAAALGVDFCLGEGIYYGLRLKAAAL